MALFRKDTCAGDTAESRVDGGIAFEDLLSGLAISTYFRVPDTVMQRQTRVSPTDMNFMAHPVS